ncbi:MAG: hypothetical protein PHW54_06490 [Candidatus Omnitrophica bacterium]|nr:hypothetical protein [Candidatus Omnitrophota bacterium]
MVTIGIRESLNNGLKFLLENPVLILLGIIANLPQLFVGAGEARLVAMFIIGFFLNVYIIALIVRFIYESKEARPVWTELSKFAIRKYALLFITYILFYIATLIGLILLIIPGFFLLIKLIFVDCGILIENDGVIGSFKRSWAITKGNWWRLFILTVICYLPVFAILALGNFLPKTTQSILSLLLNSFVFVWLQSVFTLVYLQLRRVNIPGN